MATIKTCTDISQSKVLAEILPHDSADMGWYYSRNPNAARNQMWVGTKAENADIPCWSLAALLNVLPKEYYPIKDHKTNLILGKPKDKWCVLYWDATGMQHGEETLADNPVDACVEMIKKLHELNLL